MITYRAIPCVLAIILGIFLRFQGLEQRTPFEDEAMTWLRTSGYSQTQLNERLFDGHAHTVRELMAFQTHNAEHGALGTVAVLAHDDPQHAPLYFMLEHLWSDAFGDSLGARRMVSALSGVLFIGAFGWLCAGLFGGKRAALVGAGLAAVSPFHIAYAQQAREYEPWAAIICLWSVALFNAARRDTRTAWIMYAACTITALYVSLLSLPILAAHAVWIFTRREDAARRTPFLLSAGLSVVAYLPWLVNLSLRRQSAIDENAWSGTVWPWLSFVEKWIFNLSATFFDLTYLSMHYAAVGGLVLLMVILACLDLSRRASVSSVLFIVLLAAFSVGIALIPDLLSHEHRSAAARYVLPCFIALELAVVGALAGEDASVWGRRTRYAGLCLLLAVGAWSGCVRATHSSWWESHKDAALPAISQTLNEHPERLVAAEDGTAVLALVNLLDPRIHIRMLRNTLDESAVWARPGTYLLTPTASVLTLAERKGLHPRPILGEDTTNSLRTFHQTSQSKTNDGATLFLLE